MSTRPRIVVVGGGIAGLAAAYDAAVAGAEVTVFDADRIGGKLQTAPFLGVAVDESADAFLARVPAGVGLCRDLGIEQELTSPAIGSAFVWLDGAMRRLPEGLVLGVPTDLDALAASGLISPAGVARAAEDLERAPDDPERARAAAGDESVGALVRRRLGDEVFEVLVDPLLSGVNAGRADELSLAGGAAQLAVAARSDASLIRALRAQVAAATAAWQQAGGGERPPVFFAPKGGMARLVARLVEEIGPERLHGGRAVVAITRQSDGTYDVTTAATPAAGSPTGTAGEAGSTVVNADAVVLAVPAPVAARLLADLAPSVSAAQAGLHYASVTIAALAYRPEDVPGPLDASGLLVPRRAGLFMTACSFASSKWAHQGTDGVVRLRASAGRSDDLRPDALDDDGVVAALRADLHTTMGIEAEPLAVRVHRWPASLPQYRPGHLERVAAMEEALTSAAPGIRLAGASLRGLGVPACIESGRAAARALLG